MKFQVGIIENKKRVLVKLCGSKKEAKKIEKDLKKRGYKTFIRKRKVGRWKEP